MHIFNSNAKNDVKRKQTENYMENAMFINYHIN